MGLLSRIFGDKDVKTKSGNAQKEAGAGPALAAHSKDAKTTAKTGQNSKAASAKPAAKSAATKAQSTKSATKTAKPKPTAKN